MQRIRIGHSPDPDDAFMFYGFASGQVSVDGCQIEHVLRDIQTLNQEARGCDPLEVTALSVHAFLDLEDRYDLLEVGTSAGRGYGPRVVAREPLHVADLEGLRLALPGPNTTATLTARALLPAFEEVHLDFAVIMDAVLQGHADAGVVIHEGQLTYMEHGLHLVTDLGKLFGECHQHLPLPLGVNCVLREMPQWLKRSIASAYRASVITAMTQRARAVEYALQYGRGLSVELADRFVGMYVNEDSLCFHEELRRALAVLRRYHKEQQPAKVG